MERRKKLNRGVIGALIVLFGFLLLDSSTIAGLIVSCIGFVILIIEKVVYALWETEKDDF